MRTKIHENLLKGILCGIDCLHSVCYILSKCQNKRIFEERLNCLLQLPVEQRAFGRMRLSTRAEAICMLRRTAASTGNPDKGLIQKFRKILTRILDSGDQMTCKQFLLHFKQDADNFDIKTNFYLCLFSQIAPL